MVDFAIHKLVIGLEIRYFNNEKVKFPSARTLYSSPPLPIPSCTFFPNFSSLLGNLSSSKELQCFTTTPFHRHLLLHILYHHSIFHFRPSTPIFLHCPVNRPNPKSFTYFPTTRFHSLILLIQPCPVGEKASHIEILAGPKYNMLAQMIIICRCY
jgi:hypothetical protein